MKYLETVYQYRVMRQLNDKERNPEGAWSLVFSTMNLTTAIEEMKDQIELWARCGDGFKIVDAGVAEQKIERSMW